MPTPRPDRRRLRTRTALLKAGQTLFADRSVDGVSIDEIVQAADVAKGSFYNHFADKDALALALAEQARRSAETTVAIASEGVADPAERVARALCLFIRNATEFPEPARLMLRLFHGAAVPDAPMNAGVRADIQLGLTNGRFQGLGREAAILLAVGVAQIGVARTLERGTADGAEDLARDLARDLAQGLLRGLGLAPGAAHDVAKAAATAIFKPTRTAGPET